MNINSAFVKGHSSAFHGIFARGQMLLFDCSSSDLTRDQEVRKCPLQSLTLMQEPAVASPGQTALPGSFSLTAGELQASSSFV